MKLKLTLKYLPIGAFIFTACTGQPSLPKIDEMEVQKYERNYLAEYDKIKQQNLNYKDSFKWIQPKNKKEKCKIYVSINPKDDKTIKANYKLFWDGKCKNGYAYGLGREIETTLYTNIQQIGYYEGGKAKEFCSFIDPLNNITKEGTCSYNIKKPNYSVTTKILDENGNLEINYTLENSGTTSSPALFVQMSPFSNVQTYIKAYPNFAYIITDLSKEEFDNRNFHFTIAKKPGKSNGFGFETLKQGGTISGEVSNGNLIRRVILPQSYFNKVSAIFDEIKQSANISLEAQKRALIIKNKYKKRICKKNIKVPFMNNKEYKDICNEDKKFKHLKIKIDQKLAQINKLRQEKRNQINTQRLIQAREMEALAARQRAITANNMQAFNSFMTSLNSINRSLDIANMRMQQSTNNMMMFNQQQEHNRYLRGIDRSLRNLSGTTWINSPY